jgi:hypothetical protein
MVFNLIHVWYFSKKKKQGEEEEGREWGHIVPFSHHGSSPSYHHISRCYLF